MTVRYRERALADLESIFQFLNERSPGGARNVLAATDGTFSKCQNWNTICS